MSSGCLRVKETELTKSKGVSCRKCWAREGVLSDWLIIFMKD